MEYIYKLYLNLAKYVPAKNIYQVMVLGALAIVLLVVSAVTTNHTVETWGSLFAGLSFGLFVIGTPAIIAYFKKGKQRAGN